MPKPFNSAKHFANAKLYKTRSEFARNCKGSYDLLWRKGLLDQACAHMELSPVYVPPKWTHASVFAEAAKYRNRAEFKRECSGAHGYALKHGILNQSCSHMREGHNFWHVFELMAVAIKYRDKSDFIRREKSAYDFAIKRGLLDVTFAHMQSKRRTWDKGSVLQVAKDCRSRGELQALHSGAYKHADQYGYLDEACSHMPPPEYGFSKAKPASLYHLRIATPDGFELFKVGITNRDPAARVAGMGLFPGVSAEVISVINFDLGRDARMVEKRLHRKFSSHRYGGPPVMKNGNTELFTVNVLDA